MSWDSILLNDGRSVPSIAFGSAARRSAGAASKSVDDLTTAIRLGFRHLDTAQQYGNEADVGQAIAKSGLARSEIFVTTKWSDGSMSARQAMEQSLANLNLAYVDLYVIHHTWTCNEDYASAWKQMEELQQQGLAKSIGLSAFDYSEVKAILDSCTVVPAVNMIMLNPVTLPSMTPVLDLMKNYGIVPGGYSSLKPLWDTASSSKVLCAATEIGEAEGHGPEQVVLRWCRAKGAIVYTSSTSAERTQRYISAGALRLSNEQVEAIDTAGIRSS